MKNEITRFCEACLNLLNPFPAALNSAADHMDKSAEKALLHGPLVAMNDIRHRLRSLMEKLGCQQAYLLIFGPLKSGKSTLMNAISGAYVSEVTSLPGYPCLVFVRHAEKPHFSVTRYNGKETVYPNSSVLKDTIEDSHLDLAAQIRMTEESGHQFDPRTHFTEAIRRVDVKVPVQTLAESSTVLVDTPGLYSRMNFGYDVLTREFRDTAACAVFVVKTDNLYLEQVFAEFNQLLGMFSRIFLVINVDSSKRDLQADGSLKPSAESRNPERIIEAFKTLSMAGPMRHATEQRRLRIHAIDLLSAASCFLSRNNNDNGNAAVDDTQKAAFDTFQRDLTDYLNSSDYTMEFIRDSLRQGYTLCEEARAVAEGTETDGLRDRQEHLASEIAELGEKIAAVDRLLKVDWDSTFEKVRTENATRATQVVTAKAAQISKQMRDALEGWYESNDSLKALEERHWNPLLIDAAHSLADVTRSRLNTLMGTSLGGAEPAASVMTDLHAVGFRLGAVTQAAMPKLSQTEPDEGYRMSIKEGTVPVRKSFADWILFRRAATVQKRLFGEQLTLDIDPEMKRKRLAEKSRETFVQMIDQTVRDKFPSLPTAFSERLLNEYVAKFRETVLEGLRVQRDQLARQRADRQTPFEINAQILASMEELKEQAVNVGNDLNVLAVRENVPPLIPPAPAAASEAEPERPPVEVPAEAVVS